MSRRVGAVAGCASAADGCGASATLSTSLFTNGQVRHPARAAVATVARAGCRTWDGSHVRGYGNVQPWKGSHGGQFATERPDGPRSDRPVAPCLARRQVGDDPRPAGRQPRRRRPAGVVLHSPRLPSRTARQAAGIAAEMKRNHGLLYLYARAFRDGREPPCPAGRKALESLPQVGDHPLGVRELASMCWKLPVRARAARSILVRFGRSFGVDRGVSHQRFQTRPAVEGAT